ncbi:MAG: Hsp20/alpha crystallin family protein [Anaerocolumna sp.]
MRNRDEDGNNFFSLFPGLDKFINVVADMVDNEKDEVNIKGDIKPDNQRKITGKYGINIKLGTDGTNSFNDTKSFDKIFTKKENGPKKVVPVTDIFEDEDKVTIVAELPGVEKEDIELNLDENTVSLTASKKDICYTKQVALKFIPDYSSIIESYNNSIYSVMIKKK